MSVLSFTTHVDLDGSTIAGDLNTPNTLGVTGDIHRAFKTLAAAGFDVIWNTGEGGLANFDVCIIEVTGTCWVEFRNDHTSAAEYAAVEVTADNPLILPSGSLGSSAATQIDGVAWAANTEFGLIDSIAVQNDTASAIQVKLTLVT